MKALVLILSVAACGLPMAASAHEFPLMPGEGPFDLRARLIPDKGGAWGKTENGLIPTEISGLRLKDSEALSLVSDPGSSSGVAVALEGVYDRNEEWSLLCAAKPAALSPVNGSKKPFRFLLAIDDEHLKVECTSVDPTGRIDKTSFRLEVPMAAEDLKKALSSEAWRKHALMLFVGPSFLSYREDGLSAFSQGAANVSVGYQLAIPKTRFHVQASTFITGLPYLPNFGGSAASSTRIWEAGLLGGYQLPWVKAPWALSARLGLYYKTMITASDAFGFTRMIAPTLMPVLQRRFSAGGTGFAYVRYSPTLSSSVINFQNVQVIAGLGYVFRLKGGWELTVGGRGVYTNLVIDSDGALAIDGSLSVGVDLWPFAARLKDKLLGSGGPSR